MYLFRFGLIYWVCSLVACTNRVCKHKWTVASLSMNPRLSSSFIHLSVVLRLDLWPLKCCKPINKSMNRSLINRIPNEACCICGGTLTVRITTYCEWMWLCSSIMLVYMYIDTSPVAVREWIEVDPFSSLRRGTKTAGWKWSCSIFPFSENRSIGASTFYNESWDLERFQSLDNTEVLDLVVVRERDW